MADNNSNVDRDSQMLLRALQSQMQLGRIEVIRDTARERFAMSLLTGGVSLIPSDVLQDNEIVVSRPIYEAAR